MLEVDEYLIFVEELRCLLKEFQNCEEEIIKKEIFNDIELLGNVLNLDGR